MKRFLFVFGLVSIAVLLSQTPAPKVSPTTIVTFPVSAEASGLKCALTQNTANPSSISVVCTLNGVEVHRSTDTLVIPGTMVSVNSDNNSIAWSLLKTATMPKPEWKVVARVGNVEETASGTF